MQKNSTRDIFFLLIVEKISCVVLLLFFEEKKSSHFARSVLSPLSIREREKERERRDALKISSSSLESIRHRIVAIIILSVVLL